MDRENIYSEWLSKKIIGQSGNPETFCSKELRIKFDKICDENFLFYVNYQSYYLNTKKDGENSIKGIRSKILDFLLSTELSNNSLAQINDDVIDDYFMNIYKSNSERQSTYISRINYISGFFGFLFSQNYISHQFNFGKYRNLQFNEERPSNNHKQSLTARQISEFYNSYSDRIDYLYIFEMKYYTSFNDRQIQNISIENVDIANRIITIEGYSQKVPDSIIRNILTLYNQRKLNKLPHVNQFVSNLKPFFAKIGFENFKAKDITETKDKLLLRCPQCGNEFEAIIDNWCAIQYAENGKLWIICRECGNA